MANNETELEKEDEALQNTEQIYDQLVDAADSTYKAQIDAANAFEKEQLKAMDQQTDFAIEEIRQNKAEAEKDYNREQSAAYADYKKQTDPYGVNAEHMASAGLSGSGYSESSKVAMYNAMQNRIASARDSIARVTANYNLAITEARSQNNVAKAKLAYETLVKTLELSLNGLQYKNNLLLEKARQEREIKQMYHDQYQDVLKQINTENALASASGSSGGSFEKSSGGIKSTISKLKAAAEEIKNIKSSSGTSFGKATVDMQSILNLGKATVDMQSILNLGKGPISATTLNNLVESGQVEEYEEDGKLKFRNKVKSDSIFNNPLR